MPLRIDLGQPLALIVSVSDVEMTVVSNAFESAAAGAAKLPAVMKSFVGGMGGGSPATRPPTSRSRSTANGRLPVAASGRFLAGCLGRWGHSQPTPNTQRQNSEMPQSPRLDLRPGVSEPVVLLISRREVEAADLASVLSRLKVFLATREDAWLYRGQMTLVVDGYNNDSRELVDIPEVRTLLRGLESSWPQWAFLTRSTTASSCSCPA